MATVSKKEKKERKFNSDRTARLVKNALKSVFPKDNFIVSSFVDRVEVLYFDSTVCSASELNMFGESYNVQVFDVCFFYARNRPYYSI